MIDATNLPIQPSVFMFHGQEIFRRQKKAANGTADRRFRACFGASPLVCAIIWKGIAPVVSAYDGYSPTHLLWALMFMKLYCLEPVNASIVGVDEKTFRKWSWIVIDAIESLYDDVVS